MSPTGNSQNSLNAGSRQNRRKKTPGGKSNVEEVLSRWYFVLVVIILAIASFYMIGSGGWGGFGIYMAFTAIFCGVFYIFGQMHLFGGADAWALIFIAFCIPTFPIIPL